MHLTTLLTLLSLFGPSILASQGSIPHKQKDPHSHRNYSTSPTALQPSADSLFYQTCLPHTSGHATSARAVPAALPIPRTAWRIS